MNVVWSPMALYDLRSIENHISEDNPKAAKKTVLAIRAFALKQFAMPRSGRAGKVQGTFELVVPRLPYTIIYRMNDKDIDIARVLHQRRLWPDKI